MNSSEEKDDSIKAGADLLLKGWKMMNKACPECIEPLYEKKGKVVCVKCKKDYVLVDSSSELPREQGNKINQTTKTSHNHSSNGLIDFNLDNLPPALADTAKVILVKITDLKGKLQDSTDSTEIAELSSSIKSLIDTLRSLT